MQILITRIQRCEWLGGWSRRCKSFLCTRYSSRHYFVKWASKRRENYSANASCIQTFAKHRMSFGCRNGGVNLLLRSFFFFVRSLISSWSPQVSIPKLVCPPGPGSPLPTAFSRCYAIELIFWPKFSCTLPVGENQFFRRAYYLNLAYIIAHIHGKVVALR